MPTLIEVHNELEELRSDYQKKWDSYATKTLPTGETAKDIPANDLEELNKLQEAMKEKGVLFDQMKAAEETAAESKDALEKGRTPEGRPAFAGTQETPRNHGNTSTTTKSLGDLFIESKEFQSRNGANVKEVTFDDMFGERKFMGQAAANLGFAPFVTRDETVQMAQRPPQVIDAMVIEPANSNAFKFMLQTVLTNNASAAVAEGSAASESVITYAEQTGIITKVTAWIAVSDEQLEDVDEVRSLINNDMVLIMKQTMDDYITNSNSATYGYGLLNISSIGTQAFTGYTFLDGIRLAINAVNVTGRAQATTGFFHSTNVMNGIDLLKTADGVFIFPNGLISGIGTRRVWGINIVETQASGIVATAGAGVGVVFDSAYAKVKMRKDITLDATASHSDYFTKNLQAIRATARMGVKCTRATAICKCTAIS